jgi:hypothetical protein
VKQLVLVAERLAAVEEVGGRVVRREDDQRAALAYLREVALDDGLGHRHVRLPVDLVNGVEPRPRPALAGGRGEQEERAADAERQKPCRDSHVETLRPTDGTQPLASAPRFGLFKTAGGF